MAIALTMLFAAPAQADLEGVGHFAGSVEPPASPGVFPEEVQLGGVGGMAVNYTGNGGVSAGTVYAATYFEGGMRIAMYSPKLGGGLEFKQRWNVPELENAPEHCGPALSIKCEPQASAPAWYVDVDVDQTTGNVYAFNGAILTAGRKMIVEYTPEGVEITRFGEKAPNGVKVADSPDLIHGCCVGVGGIAVNDSGDVYVHDINGAFDNSYHRLMKFQPKVPGVFTEYEYAGSGEDIGAGFQNEGRRPLEPVADEAGNIYIGSEERFIEAYDPANPDDPPVCEFDFSKTGVTAITVNPKTGTPFFFSYKTKRIYQLGPCDPGTGEFEGGIIGETIVTPERDDLWGLAVNPVAKFSPTRPAGVLYGGAARPVPESGVGVGEPGRTSLGYIFAPAEELPPVVESEAVLRVTERTTRLSAVIDAEGAKTKYVFQYLTENAYQAEGETFAGAAEAPIGGGFMINPTGAQEAVVTLSGLSPDTDYRYRVVATSNCALGEPEKVCEDTGEAEGFRTYPVEAPGLRDGRVYELVSPAQKNSGQVLPAEPGIGSCGADCKPGSGYDHFPMQSSSDGEAVAYEGTSFAPGTGVSKGNQYIARRDPNLGWLTINLSPGQMQIAGRGYQAVNEELTQALFGQIGPALGGTAAPPEYKNLYSESTSSPQVLTPLLTSAPPSRPASEAGAFEVRYAGASADLSRIFFAANDVLTAEVPGIAPTPENDGAETFNLYEWEAATGQLRLVNVFPGNATTKAGATFGVEAGSAFGVPSAHPVSADGSRVFWSDNAGKVYVREDAAMTKEIPDVGKFLSAATDGSRVLLNNGHLYDLETEVTTDLTGGKGAAGFKGLAGQSDDLSHVYFVDTDVLTGEEVNSEGAKAQAGKFNLYAWDGEGEVPTTHYVATLLAGDNSGSNIAHSRTWSPLPSQRSAQASPDGRFFSFLSEAPLTGFDNVAACAGGEVKILCPEVFLYDSEDEVLSCASCNRSGAHLLGFSTLRVIDGLVLLPQPRYMLDSGRLYFDSQDSLNQFDTNDGVEDVYEYEPEESGGCTREGGCVTMLSAGRSGIDSNFLAVDASGKNVFFTTRDRLVGADIDELVDLYDARENGGFGFEAHLPQGHCQGEGCQMPPPAPAPAPPASENPGGEGGNAKPLKCKKGQVKKNGKCVKKHKPKKNGAKNKKGGKAKRGGAK